MLYVAHRLFALHDRWLGGLAASALATLVGEERVFLPFCDTNEEELIAPIKGLRLYELDLERLQQAEGMLAVLHGPSLDDGVCFELGYAARLGTPIVAFSSDFQSYGATAAGGSPPGAWNFPDPLLEVLVSRLVRQARLVEAPELEESSNRFEHFAQRNLRALEKGVVVAAQALVDQVATPRASAVFDTRKGGHPTAFLEVPEVHDRRLWDELGASLRARGFSVQIAQRWDAARVSTAAALAAAAADWQAVARSALVVAGLDGPETPCGAAAILGAARAQGAATYGVYHSQLETYAEGREPNARNLMVQYGLSGWIRSEDDLARLQAPPGSGDKGGA